ncbi:MAG: carboxypeptidase regulatory-like domain-containing protein [Acidobacteriota bacterium]|nr:carboxypeptidase regulatory-like domain-containing protein [Acidobacteriota bacterium]
MMRRLHLAFFIALIATGSVSASGAAPGSVAGVVRDSAGVPQIGAVVQLLRPDLSLIAVVYTNSKGRFSIPSIPPGRYTVKAMGTSFLPSLRENVHVRRGTIVNLTLNTLYEVMQWLPAEPRAANAQKDDWAWTLRSAANRPLLRWLEDGPLVVVSDGPGARPRLKARLLATGKEGTFGESGERITASLEDTPSNSRELLASVDFSPGTDGAMESMLGFRQDLGFAGSVQSVAAVAIHPEIDGPGAGGLQEAVVRSWESINLGDEFEAEVGSEQVVARFASSSPNVAVESLPFATVGWRNGDSTVRYRMTTFIPGAQNDTDASAWLPALSATRNGDLAFEHGLHQEIGWERRTDASGMTFLVYADQIENPVLEAAANTGGGQAPPFAASALLDGVSGLLRAAGPAFSTAGMMASVERSLPGGNNIRLSYANGDALVMTASSRPIPFAQVLAAARPRRVQTYALALSGTLEGTGTRWRASYRWQPEDTVTQVAPFTANAVEPYLSLHLRQPIRLRSSDGPGGIDALLNVGNLLAQGYRPMVLSDGSLLIFAQSQRSVGAGLAFTF